MGHVLDYRGRPAVVNSYNNCMSFKHSAWAWEKKGLSATQKLVLLSLAHCINSKTGKCWPSNKQVGQHTGLHPVSVSIAIKKLREKGLIKITRRWKNSSIIELRKD